MNACLLAEFKYHLCSAALLLATGEPLSSMATSEEVGRRVQVVLMNVTDFANKSGSLHLVNYVPEKTLILLVLLG